MTGLNIVGLVDNWSAIVAIVGPIIGFMCTAMIWLRGYIKAYMKDMKAEHREDMKSMETRWDKRSTEMEERHREDVKTIREEMKEINSHWREMFTYMNNKIDEVRKPS